MELRLLPGTPVLVSELPSTSPHVERWVGTLEGIGGAVEVWLPPREAPESWKTLFLEEAHELERLDHPALAKVLARGTLEDRPFLVTRLRERGSPLFELVAQEDFGVEERCRVLAGVAEIYAAAQAESLCLGPPMPGLLWWNSRTEQLTLAHHRAPAVILRIPTEPDPENRSGDEVGLWAAFALWLLSRGRGEVSDPESLEGEIPREMVQLLNSCLSPQGAIRPQGMDEVAAALRIQVETAPEGEAGMAAAEEAPVGSEERPGRKAAVVPGPPAFPLGGEGFTLERGAVLAAACLGVMGWVVATREVLPAPAPRAPIQVSQEGLVPIHDPHIPDPYLHLLVKQHQVTPENFSRTWRILFELAKQGRLPQELGGRERLRSVHESYARDPELGCRLLKSLLDELRGLLEAS